MHTTPTINDANLIVNYLPATYREAEVFALFRPYGVILKVNIVYNKETDESMTYGFVRFQNPNDAITAMSELNGRAICGKRIKVGFARPGIDTSNCKLYVKRVPPSYTLDDVQNLFAQFGEILETRLLTDEKGHSRQVAFVQYTNRQDAEDAIMNLSGIVPPGGKQPLIVKYATPPKISSSSPPPSHHESDDMLPLHPQTRSKDLHVGRIPTSQSPHFAQQSHNSELYSPPVSIPSFRNQDQLVHITVNGVPSSFDLMTFNFLSNYGRVVEGKLFYESQQYGPISSHTNVSQATIRYALLIDNAHQLANVLAIDGSIVVVSGLPVVHNDYSPNFLPTEIFHASARLKALKFI